MRALSFSTSLLLVLAFAGCDSYGTDGGNNSCTYNCHPGDGGNGGGGKPDDGGSGGGTAGGGSTAGLVIDIDPLQTYLRTNDDASTNAPAIALADLGIEPGDPACFVTEGDYLWAPGESARDYFNASGGAIVTAVFSASTELAPSDARARVLKAIEAGDDIFTGGTLRGDLPTDIDQDFSATDNCLTVPAGAKYIFFAPYDNFSEDNRLIDGVPFRVRVTK